MQTFAIATILEGDAARARVKRLVPNITPSSSPLMLNFGYTYHEGALVNDGPVELNLPDPMGIFTPSTRPGCSLPDRWVADLSNMTALGDLVGRGRFVLIAGEKARTGSMRRGAWRARSPSTRSR